MNKDTGEILSYYNIPKEEKENYVPLTMREAKYLVKRKPDARKNWMRNKPCPCGSGKKFKRCCWGKKTPQKIYEEEVSCLTNHTSQE